MPVTVIFRKRTTRISKLDNAAGKLLAQLSVAMNTQAQTAVQIMRSEPPPKAGSKYVRTHTYSSSWRFVRAHKSGDRLVAGISGKAVDPRGTDYTIAVGGDAIGEGQFEMHADTGWPLASEALAGTASTFGLTKSQSFFPDRIKRTVRRVLRGDE